MRPPSSSDREEKPGLNSFRLVLIGGNGSQRVLIVPDEHALVQVMAETHSSEAPIEITYADGRILDFEMSEKVHQRLFFRLSLNKPNALSQFLSQCLAETGAAMTHAGESMEGSERLVRKYDEVKGAFIRYLHYIERDPRREGKFAAC